MNLFFIVLVLLLVQNNIYLINGKSNGTHSTLRDIESNYTLWETEGDTSYEFVFSWSCNCPRCYISEKFIKVTHASINKVTFNEKDDSSGCSDNELSKSNYKTINQLFNILLNYTTMADSIIVSFHKQLGYPIYALIDPKSTQSNEEFGWTINCLTIYSRSDITDFCDDDNHVCFLYFIFYIFIFIFIFCNLYY